MGSLTSAPAPAAVGLRLHLGLDLRESGRVGDHLRLLHGRHRGGLGDGLPFIGDGQRLHLDGQGHFHAHEADLHELVRLDQGQAEAVGVESGELGLPDLHARLGLVGRLLLEGFVALLDARPARVVTSLRLRAHGHARGDPDQGLAGFFQEPGHGLLALLVELLLEHGERPGQGSDGRADAGLELSRLLLELLHDLSRVVVLVLHQRLELLLAGRVALRGHEPDAYREAGGIGLELELEAEIALDRDGGDLGLQGRDLGLDLRRHRVHEGLDLLPLLERGDRLGDVLHRLQDALGGLLELRAGARGQAEQQRLALLVEVSHLHKVLGPRHVRRDLLGLAERGLDLAHAFLAGHVDVVVAALEAQAADQGAHALLGAHDQALLAWHALRALGQEGLIRGPAQPALRHAQALEIGQLSLLALGRGVLGQELLSAIGGGDVLPSVVQSVAPRRGRARGHRLRESHELGLGRGALGQGLRHGQDRGGGGGLVVRRAGADLAEHSIDLHDRGLTRFERPRHGVRVLGDVRLRRGGVDHDGGSGGHGVGDRRARSAERDGGDRQIDAVGRRAQRDRPQSGGRRDRGAGGGRGDGSGRGRETDLDLGERVEGKRQRESERQDSGQGLLRGGLVDDHVRLLVTQTSSVVI